MNFKKTIYDPNVYKVLNSQLMVLRVLLTIPRRPLLWWTWNCNTTFLNWSWRQEVKIISSLTLHGPRSTLLSVLYNNSLLYLEWFQTSKWVRGKEQSWNSCWRGSNEILAIQFWGFNWKKMPNIQHWVWYLHLIFRGGYLGHMYCISILSFSPIFGCYNALS